MTHNISLVSVLILALFMSAAAVGQGENAELDAARAQMQAGRDQIIREDLQLSEDELARFWPIYQQYVSDLSVIRDRKATLVGRFMQAYQGGEFSDEFAVWLIEENFAIKSAWAGVQKAYVDQYMDVVPAQAVARFYQLENKLDAEVDAQLALVVPLVE
jgi:hypothetical protein